MDTKFEKGFFVIGTDTDIGKTFVSALLVKGIKKLNGSYYKPVQSGCYLENDNLIAPDVKYICDFNNIDYDKNMVSYSLKEEVSPHLAAEIEKISIDKNKIIEDWNRLKNRYNYLIVEGAGGIYVPIIRNKLYIYDLVKSFNIPVILVCSSKVGTINHTIMSINTLREMGIKIQGIVFNKVGEKLYEKDNINIILELSNIKNYIIIKENQNEIPDDELKVFLNL